MRNINKDKYGCLFILLAFGLYLFYLLYTGRINIFIHPRLAKYTVFALLTITILFCFQIKNIFQKETDGPHKKGYIIFLLPLFLGIIVNPDGLSAEFSRQKEINLMEETHYENMQEYTRIDDKKKEAADYVSEVEHADIIEINDNNYVPVWQAIYENLSNYEGKKITLNGFVIKTNNCKQDQFFLARIYLFCCAACAQPIGFYCEWEKTETLPEEQWVKITAVIDSMPYPDPDLSKKFIIPLLKVENVEDIEAPETPYVYPQW